ncbi:MAG TPA: hypothetical protein VHX37_06895 [Acidobacteriaceae bacterium]|jgi:hypothetical protein|nr:hypothetical protein [Acidobacteriaceae bacterium]
MKKNAMQFYYRYHEDGSCKVICMNCYATLGTGWDRDAVTQMEAGHICGEWKRAAERLAGEESAGQQSIPLNVRPSPSLLHPSLSPQEWRMARLHPAILVALTALLLYVAPTVLEMLARRKVNTWLSVILPGDLLGCMVLGALAKMPRTAIALYLLLTACECYWQVMHAMRGITMAWIVDLVPTLVVIGVLLMRAQRVRGMMRGAFS